MSIWEMSRIATKGLVVPLISFWSFFVPTLTLTPNNAFLANMDKYRGEESIFKNISTTYTLYYMQNEQSNGNVIK